MADSSDQSLAVRKWQRYAFQVPVLVHIAVNLREERTYLPFRGDLRDVCPDGVGIQVPINMRDGSELQIESPPVFGAQSMTVSATIRNHRDGNVYGLEFIGNSEADRRAQQILITVLSAMGKPVEGQVADRNEPRAIVAEAVEFEKYLAFLEQDLGTYEPPSS